MTEVSKVCPECGEVFHTVWDRVCEKCQKPKIWVATYKKPT